MGSQPDLQRQGRARGSSRVSVVLEVGLRRSGSHQVHVELRDISTHGFRAELFERVYVGERLWLKLPGLEGWHARVAWARGDQIGCEFVQPLHPAVLNIIVMKAGSAAR